MLQEKIIAIKKLLLFFIVGGSLLPCFGIKNEASNKEDFNDDEIKVIVTSIDSLSMGLYFLIKFQREKTLEKGILLVMKTNRNTFSTGEMLSVKLCDVTEYKSIQKKTASNSLNITLNRKNVELIGGIDTITFCCHFNTNGQIYIEDKLILDFSDNTNEPVFKICDYKNLYAKV